jgi:hypothetical protein
VFRLSGLLTALERAFYGRRLPSFHIKPDACAVTLPWAMGHGGGNCPQPPTVRAVWRFDTPGPLQVLLCDEHAAELASHERLSLAAR